VLLDAWPVRPSPEPGRFTTVARWRGGYGRLEHEGRLYGQKAHELRALAALPERVAATLEIALAIDDADKSDRELLCSHGWRVVDPAVAATPDAVREYIAGSGAELSVAQGAYVATRSGWLSDRTACYLATGRPAVVQETGLSDVLATGEGLLTFSTLDEAAVAIEQVQADHPRHCAAARAIAEEHLDSDRVLAELLEVSLAR
jgi:hypothetical protein